MLEVMWEEEAEQGGKEVCLSSLDYLRTNWTRRNHRENELPFEIEVKKALEVYFPEGNIPESLEKKLSQVARDVQGCGRPIVILKQECCGEYKTVYCYCERSATCERCKGTLSKRLQESCEKLAVYAYEKKETLALMTLTLKERGAEGLERWGNAMTKWLESRLVVPDLAMPEGLSSGQRERQSRMLEGLREWKERHPKAKVRDLFSGGIRMLELSGGGSHVHVHCLVSLKALVPQVWLSWHWEKTTGSKVVDIRKVQGRKGQRLEARQVGRYVAGYVTKEGGKKEGKGLSKAEGMVLEALMFGRPMYRTFGVDREGAEGKKGGLAFLKVDLKKKASECPHCGKKEGRKIMVGVVRRYSEVDCGVYNAVTLKAGKWRFWETHDSKAWEVFGMEALEVLEDCIEAESQRRKDLKSRGFARREEEKEEACKERERQRWGD
jgi:hypothetical protein